MGELDRKWKTENQQRTQERIMKKDPSYYQIGELTIEEKELPISKIKEIIRERRHDKWAQQMRDKGIELHFCDICQQLATPQHQCMSTHFRVGNGKRPVHKELVLSQRSGGNVTLRETKTIDHNRLQKEFENISAIRDPSYADSGSGTTIVKARTRNIGYHYGTEYIRFLVGANITHGLN